MRPATDAFHIIDLISLGRTVSGSSALSTQATYRSNDRQVSASLLPEAGKSPIYHTSPSDYIGQQSPPFQTIIQIRIDISRPCSKEYTVYHSSQVHRSLLQRFGQDFRGNRHVTRYRHTTAWKHIRQTLQKLSPTPHNTDKDIRTRSIHLGNSTSYPGSSTYN